MPNPVVNDLLKLVVAEYVPPQIGEITFGWRVQSITGAGATLFETAQFFLTSLTADWQAASSSKVTLSGAIVYLLNRATGRAVASGLKEDNATAGAVGGNLCPRQAAAVIRKVTAMSGRAFRGRVYKPFLPAAFIDAVGEITGAGKAAIQTYIGNLYTTTVIVGGGGTMTLVPVLIHSPLPLTEEPVLVTSISPKIGNQRRRGDYGQPNSPL